MIDSLVTHPATDPSLSPFPLVSPETGARPTTVVLFDGQTVCLANYRDDELARLHFDQEIAFAAAIQATEKKSLQRSELTRQGYQTICQILDELAVRGGAGQLLSMGMDARYIRLVLEVLKRQQRFGFGDGMFEVGFGSGLMLRAAAEAGYRVGGIEVAPQLLMSAQQILAPTTHDRLILGNFLDVDLSAHQGRYSLVYWNDVFEHVAVDEIDDYLTRIRSLLAPGGKLLTITPNWHMRPSDVTAVFHPPRTEAIGFHMQEYTLAEVRQCLIRAGFSRVQTPAYISRRRIWMSPLGDLTLFKVACEPMLEWLPFRVAVQCCRRFGLNCTLATN